MTSGRRLALIAVANGAVRVDDQGCRDYPGQISGTALTAAYDAGLWRWPASAIRAARTKPGDVAELTDAGREALQ